MTKTIDADDSRRSPTLNYQSYQQIDVGYSTEEEEVESEEDEPESVQSAFILKNKSKK